MFRGKLKKRNRPLAVLKKHEYIKVWLDKHRIIRAIRRGISENPASLIGTDAIKLMPVPAHRKAFLKAFAGVWYYKQPTLYMELDLIIDDRHHTRQCHILRDPDNPELVLLVFYAVEE